MKRLIKIFSIMVLSVIITAPLVSGQVTKKEKELRGEVEMKAGNKVRLFHSGTADVKKIICIGDVIPVYREVYGYGAEKKTEVGKVKVLGYAGEHYFEAEILEGKVRNGDIVQKESASCMLVPKPKEE